MVRPATRLSAGRSSSSRKGSRTNAAGASNGSTTPSSPSTGALMPASTPSRYSQRSASSRLPSSTMDRPIAAPRSDEQVAVLPGVVPQACEAPQGEQQERRHEEPGERHGQTRPIARPQRREDGRQLRTPPSRE